MFIASEIFSCLICLFGKLICYIEITYNASIYPYFLLLTLIFPLRVMTSLLLSVFVLNLTINTEVNLVHKEFSKIVQFSCMFHQDSARYYFTYL